MRNFILALLFICAYSLPPVTEYGYWGDWSPQYSTYGFYLICGAELRVEKQQGSGDDTAANGIRMIFCQPGNWRNQRELVYEGLWGDWKGVVMCPENYFVDAFQARIEPKQGSKDDTALNGLNFRCKNPATSDNKVITIFPGYWGTWREWHYATPVWSSVPYFFDSFSVRFEAHKSGSFDDTAMNGLAFYPTPQKKASPKRMSFSVQSAGYKSAHPPGAFDASLHPPRAFDESYDHSGAFDESYDHPGVFDESDDHLYDEKEL